MDLTEQIERMQIHYGLKHDPLGALVDTMVFSGAGGRYETAETIRHLLTYSPQDSILVGPSGSGKRALVSQVIKMLESQWRVAWIDGSMLQTTSDLFQEVIGQLGLGLKVSDIESQEVSAVINAIDSRVGEDELFLLVVQYADQVPAFLLEMMGELRNQALSLESRLRQIWLVNDDQPMSGVIDEDDWYVHKLQPLTDEEAYQYLKDRFIAAGYVDTFPIGPKDVNRLNDLSGGIPKELNEITRDYLISSTFQGVEKKTSFPVTHVAAGLTALVLVIIAFVYQANDHRRGDEVVVLQHSPSAEQSLSDVERKLADAVARVEAKQDSAEAITPEPKVIAQPEEVKAPLSPRVKAPEPVASDDQTVVVLPSSADDAIPVVQNTTTSESGAAPVSLLQSAKDEEYTLQLIGVRDRSKLSAMLEAFAPNSSVEVVETVYKDAPWYVLIFGKFPDKASAQKGATEIPDSLGISEPWARSFSSIRNSQ
ncbi:MAG: SPOR domain-containing protein [Reinekea sp.]